MKRLSTLTGKSKNKVAEDIFVSLSTGSAVHPQAVTQAKTQEQEWRSGLQILHQPEGQGADVDIVAVHGLDANPARTWKHKAQDADGRDREVSWLQDADMLPSKLPSARIFAFNYLSRWLSSAPKHRGALCAEELLQGLHQMRTQENATRDSPLIFIRHSYGGIVIERAVLIANARDQYRYISTATVGIAFLGAPLRGSKFAKWATVVAKAGNALGLASSHLILQELEEGSERLQDVLHEFTLWLNRNAVPACCFFELLPMKLSGHVIVDESNACIDGFDKRPLEKDHVCMNKFDGPLDAAYVAVSAILMEWAQRGPGRVNHRRNPVPSAHLACVRALCLSEPKDDLVERRRIYGRHKHGTCEWILARSEYSKWLVEPKFSILRLIGNAGIGKTTISMFLVEELQAMAEKDPQMTLAYYLCDNRYENRRTSTAILRGLLLQILRQNPALWYHIQPDFDVHQKALFSNVDALWRIFFNVISDPHAGKVVLLVDALDECTERPPSAFVQYLGRTKNSMQRGRETKAKLLITSRPMLDDHSLDEFPAIQIDSAMINANLQKFIEGEVDATSKMRSWPPELCDTVKKDLSARSDGTFLWVSLVLRDLATARKSNVLKKLESMPIGLKDVYHRMLVEIKPEDQELAVFLLRCVPLARRPLTTTELATVCYLGFHGWTGPSVPSAEDIGIFDDDWTCCRSLLRLDMDAGTPTVNLVHLSAKDFLMGNEICGMDGLSHYHVEAAEGHLQLFRICWKYLSMDNFDHVAKWMGRFNECSNVISPPFWALAESGALPFLQYAATSWDLHALGTRGKICQSNEWIQDSTRSRAELARSWLRVVAENGHEEVVELLLDICEVDAGAEDSHWRTPLSLASKHGHEAVVELLLATGKVDAEAKDGFDATPLSLASKHGHAAVVGLLLSAGKVAADSKNASGRSSLSLASEYGHEAVAKLLLATGEVDPDAKDRLDKTPLSRASERGHVAVAKLLLSTGKVAVDAKDRDGQTPLSLASEHGHDAVVKLLLATGKVSLAALDGCKALVKMAREAEEAKVVPREIWSG